MSGRKILFIDRDGTIIEEPADFQIDSLPKLRLVRDVIPALLRLQEAGYRFVMVSNQDGLGTASFPEPTFREPHEFLQTLLGSQGIRFDAEFICPHLPADNCGCRKPKAGLLDDYLRTTDIDRANSYVIGDRETDLELARNIGVAGLRIGTDLGWREIAARLTAPNRRATIDRKTKETDIRVAVDLDKESPIHVTTGLGFFDHMLEQIAKHGGFSLELTCKGDLHIDEHHTVEDCALALGQALKAALGDKRGIHRYGFVLPMDEALVQVAIDLSGRPYFVFEGKFGRDSVGQLPTELVPHFFRSLAETLGAAINIKVEGDNTHHMIEACFKGVGRTLRQAFRITDTELPSTKGTL
ncbi:MAG TPA: bifunctional histidinol-phosphatase/imidazoleglycerol-phosphate dehydratase HisB [Povalibacter sp.]|uniref:bifunctional histidinol-phosphatase/imidazoleglycerol-phosphate dehydratase HisB n=1 Tax=Povalibacter sp. TaxID=1962978 RepID=UPI002B6A32DE|nr:bifunctional histidinol-phosphatase/imidazoleglycerol-phosphate dehydratase HisB [Povalibacter sp.]HMN43256.1 bifunctional histidinol-phosphatase/imidazoleglycerol-phosphate dehydratase HisB [Povalibacter sp.]